MTTIKPPKSPGLSSANYRPRAGLAEKKCDAAWERLLADPKPRPKLAALATKALAEHHRGKATPLPRS